MTCPEANVLPSPVVANLAGASGALLCDRDRGCRVRCRPRGAGSLSGPLGESAHSWVSDMDVHGRLGDRRVRTGRGVGISARRLLVLCYVVCCFRGLVVASPRRGLVVAMAGSRCRRVGGGGVRRLGSGCRSSGGGGRCWTGGAGVGGTTDRGASRGLSVSLRDSVTELAGVRDRPGQGRVSRCRGRAVGRCGRRRS